MRLLFLLAMIFAFPAFAQTQELTRKSPMGERTSAYGLYDYISPNQNVTFPYYMIGPKNPEKGVRYPLIVVLHGRSGHAYGGWVLADMVNGGMPAFVVVPVMEANVKSWVQEAWRWKDPKYSRPIDHVAILTESIIKSLPVDPARIYVTGYSMGGAGTFGMLYYYPNLFAAGVPICGGWPSTAAKYLRSMPIWAFHGDADTEVPVAQTRDIIQAIQAQGGHPKYTEYPGVGHNSWINAYNEPELWVWLLSQSKKAKP